MNNISIRLAKIFWQLLLLPWKFMFAFVPPCHIAHGWISFICSLLFISGIAYIVTKITDLISCVTGFPSNSRYSSPLSWHFVIHLKLLCQLLLSSLFTSLTGINAYVIAFTALASGTSWPDLVASKIAAERQKTADSAIANITCRSSSQFTSHSCFWIWLHTITSWFYLNHFLKNIKNKIHGMQLLIFRVTIKMSTMNSKYLEKIIS